MEKLFMVARLPDKSLVLLGAGDKDGKDVLLAARTDAHDMMECIAAVLIPVEERKALAVDRAAAEAMAEQLAPAKPGVVTSLMDKLGRRA